MVESDIQRRIMIAITSRGGYCVKVIAASRAGVPDVVCCYKGKFIAFEVKTMTGNASDLQKANIKKIRNSGGLGYVVRSATEVITILEALQDV